MGTPYKTFSYYTFGCKVNFADSSYIARQIIDKGLSQVSIDDYADICLINTCSVTEKADSKAKKLIKGIHKRFPKSKIILNKDILDKIDDNLLLNKEFFYKKLEEYRSNKKDYSQYLWNEITLNLMLQKQIDNGI